MSIYDIVSMGYPSNALEIYKIDENVFLAAPIEYKVEMLREGKRNHESA